MPGVLLSLLMLAALDSSSDFLMSSRWSGIFALQFFGHGRTSAKSAVPDGQYEWNWTSAQGLEAPAEEKENALSRLLIKGLNAISEAQKLLILVS